MRTLLLFIASLTVAIATDERPAATAWDVAASGSVSVAIPRGWRNFDGMAPRMVIYRQGDGVGVPFADETGSPLQIGLTVEKFATSDDTTELIAKKTAEGAKRDPRLESIGDGTFVPVTLSDRTEGTFFTKEFIKSGHRRSLQMKLVVKDAETRVWVVSGYIVGGKDSRLPTPSSSLALWLKAHMLSLTVGGQAIDPKPLETAYNEGQQKD